MRKVRFLNLAVTLGLVVGLFAAAIGSASADPSTPGVGDGNGGPSTIYFPWVANGDEADGSGPWYSTVTIQNTEIYPIKVDLKAADGSSLVAGALLNPRASKTWTAAALGIAAPGAGVVVTGTAVGSCETLDAVTVTRAADQNYDTEVAAFDRYPGYTYSVSRVVGADGTVFTAGTDYNATINGEDVTITWLAGAGAKRPADGDNYFVTIKECPVPRIAGVEKHATPSIAGNATTNASTVSVDGYTAVSDWDAMLSNTGGWTLDGQSRWVQPIVQTNSGWNTILYVTNVSSSNNVGVTATYYAENGQGYAGPSTMIFSDNLAKGATKVFDLTNDGGFPAGEVGSVWIDADAQVVAQVYRVKAETGMALTNVAQPRNDGVFGTVLPFPFPFSPEVKYAPLVFRDYNGWNTGLNIANLSTFDNQVTITYYNYAGNVVAVESKTIPARAMEVVYRPSTANSAIADSQITSAIISGTHAVAASVDEVKYLSGKDQGQAMSYLAQWGVPAGEAFPEEPGRFGYDFLLALPLVQKGNALTGTGDTTGINLFNPDTNDGITAFVQFVDTAGVPVAPTVSAGDAEQPFVMPMGALSGATVYTMNYSEMPAGFVGSALVGAVMPFGSMGQGFLTGVSNNVNYDVEFDGSAVFNMAALWSWID